MEWVYLAVSINGAVYTVNAYKPVKRNPILFGPSFFASWITIELAWFHLVWQVAFTAAMASRGVLRTRKGKLGLALNLASWAGLALIVKRSIGSRAEIKAAFAELAPTPTELRGLGVKRTKDIPFAKAGGKTLKLDVYEPARPTPAGVKRPAILQIHGGGWVIGDKREQGLPLLRHLASQGWVGFNANYRLSPAATWPDHVVDVKRAVAWIREHADEYGIDPDFIAITGGSAGGHLCTMAALTSDDPSLQPGFEEADTSFQVAVPFYGVYDFTNRKGYMAPNIVEKFFAPWIVKADPVDEPEKFAAASPLDQVNTEAPPFLVIHGDKDTLAPVEGARDFVEELRAVSKAPVLYLELKGAQHAFEIFPSIRANQVVRAAEQFLNAVFEQHLAGRDAEQLPADLLAAEVDAATPGHDEVHAH